MNTNGTNNLNPDTVLRAVQTAIDLLPPDQKRAFALSPVPAGIHHSAEGDWVVPVASGMNGPSPSGYHLHQVLSQIQHDVEEKIHALVSITLAA